MVNIGDTVLVTFQARGSFTGPLYVDPAQAVTARLAANGFRVLRADFPGTLAQDIIAAVTAGISGWSTCQVTVQPISSAYGSPQDVAGIVAGAAEAIGLQVDTANATGQVIATARTQQSPASSDAFQQNLAQSGALNQQSSGLSSLAATLGVSAGTLEIGLIGAAIIAVLAISRR